MAHSPAVQTFCLWLASNKIYFDLLILFEYLKSNFAV